MKKKVADGFVRRMDHVVWKVVEGKGILLNLENGAYFDVDPVGLEIWKLCDVRKNLNDIVLSISRAFKADLARVNQDVTRLIGELNRCRLAEIVSTPIRAVALP